MQSDHADTAGREQTPSQNNSGSDDVAHDSDPDPEDFLSGVESFDIEMNRELLNQFTLRRPEKEDIVFENDAQEQLYDILLDHVGKDNAIYSAELAEQVHPDDGDGQPETREDLATLIKNGAPILAGGNGYYIADDLGEVADYGDGMISRIQGNLKRLERAIQATIESKARARTRAAENPRQSVSGTASEESSPQDDDDGDDGGVQNDIWGEEWRITIRADGNLKASEVVQQDILNAIRDHLLSGLDTHTFEAGDRPDDPRAVPDHPTESRRFVIEGASVSLSLTAPEEIHDAEFDELVSVAAEKVPAGWRMVSRQEAVAGEKE